MSHFFRNAWTYSTPERKEALRKSEEQRHQARPDVQALDSLTTSVGPDRGPSMDFREQQLAKAEAADHALVELRKREDAEAAARCKSYTLRDGPQPRRAPANETVTTVQTRYQAFNKAANRASDAAVSASGAATLDDVSKTCDAAKASLAAITKNMDAVIAEHHALMRKINGQDDDDGDDDDNGGAPPTGAVPVKDTKPRSPGSANRVHQPHPESPLATRDQRTVASTHNLNRRVRGAPVQKSGGTTRLVNVAGVDLSTIFTGVQLKPA